MRFIDSRSFSELYTKQNELSTLDIFIWNTAVDSQMKGTEFSFEFLIWNK